MSMVPYNWILLLWLILCVLRISGFSLNITRGHQDSIYTNIRQKPISGLICDVNDICKCKDGLTYIFDSNSLTGKCVRDYEIIKDRSKGKLLPVGREKCIGVKKDERITKMNCNVNEPSVKWIWTIDEQMLNLKTLRCLKGDTRINKKGTKIKEFSIEQCDKSASKQKWVCASLGSQNVTNRGIQHFISKWIKTSDTSYFQNCNQNIDSYKGCYRFSDGNHMKLINRAGCDTQHNDTCGLNIKIQAPIGTGYTSCQLDWTTSAYAISGFHWYPFNEIIEGVQLSSTLYPVTLQIKNKSSLLSRWKGHLFRLNIQCRNNVGRSESHCALLKVEGTATEEIPVADEPPSPYPIPTAPTNTTLTASQIPSQPTSSTTLEHRINMTSTSTSYQKLSSTNTSYTNSQGREDNKDSSIILPIVIAAVALFCLLLAVVVIVIVCKRRKRKKDDENQNEEHIYEEANHVDNGPVSPIYMEIDNFTRSKSKKSNSSRKRNKSQTNEESTDNPFYHTLERTDHIQENAIYEELDEMEKPPELAKPPEPAKPPAPAKLPVPATFEKEIDV